MFIKTIFLSFMVLALIPFQARAQENQYDAQYAAMVNESRAMPEAFDFQKARDLYTKTSFFSPYGVNAKIDFQEFFKRQDSGDLSVMDEVSSYAEKNFAMPEAHTRAMVLFKKFGKPEKQNYHEWAARGLIKALRDSGDGLTPQTAIDVVNISEEYLIARQHGERGGQRIENVNNRVYDVLTVIKKDTGEKLDLWFDITDIFGKGL